MNILNGVKTILLVFLIAASYGKCYAQQWINYSVANGLSHNDITAIVEDDHGKIWVGTFGGLNQFNGRDWNSYSRAEGDSVIDDYIKTLMKDSEGKLWIGTWGGLMIIDPDEDLRNPANWHNYNYHNTKGGLLDTAISVILEDDSGKVWIGTEGKGICIVNPTPSGNEDDPLLNPDNWTYVYLDSQWLNLSVIDLEKDLLGNIWVGTLGGVWRYNPKEYKITDSGWDSIPGVSDLYSIFTDRNGTVWFGCAHGVARVSPENPHSIAQFPFARNVVTMVEDSDDKIWFGTIGSGVYAVDPKSNLTEPQNWFQYSQKDGLASNVVSCLFQDSEGDIWMGTGEKGISKYDISWINFSQAKIKLDFTSVIAIAKDDSHNLWLGTEDKGIRMVNLNSNLLVNENWQIIRKQEKVLASDYINTIFKDDSGFLWIGTTPDPSHPEDYKGLHVVNPSTDLSHPENWLTFTVENTDSGLIDNTVNTIGQDRKRYMWFGTNNGLSRVHRDSITSITNWTNYDSSNGLLNNRIKSIFLDHKNFLWLGMTNGLNLKNLNEDKKEDWKNVKVMNGKEINTIFQDLEGNLWFGTKKNGVFKVNPSSDIDSYTNWQVFASENGLASNNVRSIAQRAPFEYWFATASGLTRLSVSGADSIWTIFKAEDGPESISIWSAFKDSKGDLWFGTGERGLTRHRVKSHSPETAIISKFDVITVENVLIAFKGYDLTTPPRMLRYSYQLDNKGWSPFEYAEVVQFFGLNNGRHLFEVRAIDMDGNIDTQPARDVFYKIDPGLGGKVEFCDSVACVRLYFPPGTLKSGKDGAKITQVKNYELLDTAQVMIAYCIEFQDLAAQPGKSPTLSISILNSGDLDPTPFAIFRLQEAGGWNGIGGTVNSIADSLIITTAISEPGIYAVRKARITEPLEAKINVQPRVFSPSGHEQRFGDRVDISFPLKQMSNVTVKIYNMAGRLKRVIIENAPLLPGVNVVEWDGRDDDGSICKSGLYVVTIEKEGKVHTKTVVVANRYR